MREAMGPQDHRSPSQKTSALQRRLPALHTHSNPLYNSPLGVKPDCIAAGHGGVTQVVRKETAVAGAAAAAAAVLEPWKENAVPGVTDQAPLRNLTASADGKAGGLAPPSSPRGSPLCPLVQLLVPEQQQAPASAARSGGGKGSPAAAALRRAPLSPSSPNSGGLAKRSLLGSPASASPGGGWSTQTRAEDGSRPYSPTRAPFSPRPEFKRLSRPPSARKAAPPSRMGDLLSLEVDMEVDRTEAPALLADCGAVATEGQSAIDEIDSKEELTSMVESQVAGEPEHAGPQCSSSWSQCAWQAARMLLAAAAFTIMLASSGSPGLMPVHCDRGFTIAASALQLAPRGLLEPAAAMARGTRSLWVQPDLHLSSAPDWPWTGLGFGRPLVFALLHASETSILFPPELQDSEHEADHIQEYIDTNEADMSSSWDEDDDDDEVEIKAELDTLVWDQDAFDRAVQGLSPKQVHPDEQALETTVQESTRNSLEGRVTTSFEQVQEGLVAQQADAAIHNAVMDATVEASHNLVEDLAGSAPTNLGTLSDNIVEDAGERAQDTTAALSDISVITLQLMSISFVTASVLWALQHCQEKVKPAAPIVDSHLTLLEPEQESAVDLSSEEAAIPAPETAALVWEGDVMVSPLVLQSETYGRYTGFKRTEDPEGQNLTPVLRSSRIRNYSQSPASKMSSPFFPSPLCPSPGTFAHGI